MLHYLHWLLGLMPDSASTLTSNGIAGGRAAGCWSKSMNLGMSPGRLVSPSLPAKPASPLPRCSISLAVSDLDVAVAHEDEQAFLARPRPCRWKTTWAAR